MLVNSARLSDVMHSTVIADTAFLGVASVFVNARNAVNSDQVRSRVTTCATSNKEIGGCNANVQLHAYRKREYQLLSAV